MNDDLSSGKALEATAAADADVDFVEDEEEEGILPLNDLPDEILILIFNRIFDLKSLCSCSLVSFRFSSLILLHVRSVYFSVPRRHHIPPNPSIPTPIATLDNPATDTLSKKLLRFLVKPLQYFRQLVSPKRLPVSPFYPDSFCSAVFFLTKFKSICSLHLVLPSTLYEPNRNHDDSPFRWTAKFGLTIETFVFLYPSSVSVTREFNPRNYVPEANYETFEYRVLLAFECLKDAIARHRMLLLFIEEHPLLQNITITDSDNQGSLSLRDSKEVAEMRNWINSASLAVRSELKQVEFPVSAHLCHVPTLNLPVSRKVMVNPTLIWMEMVDRHQQQRRDWGGDAAAIAPLFEQGEEAFGEAVVDMMVNRRWYMRTLI